MTNEQWHYEWVKTLVQEGMPVESAQAAFNESQNRKNMFPANTDPVTAAKSYLSAHPILVPEV
jgi:hypothetical protein